MGTKFSFIKKLWFIISSSIIFIAAILTIIVFRKELFSILKLMINFLGNLFISIINFIVKAHDLIFLFLILFIIVWLFIIDKKQKKQFMDVKSKLEKVIDEIKKLNSDINSIKEDLKVVKIRRRPEISQNDFEIMVRNAIHKAGFIRYSGRFDDVKRTHIYDIETAKRKKYIIIFHYWAPHKENELPSEQVNKYFNEARESKIPYILVTNAMSLKQRAQKELKEFHSKYGKEKLSIFYGSNEDEFIKKFSDL